MQAIVIDPWVPVGGMQVTDVGVDWDPHAEGGTGAGTGGAWVITLRWDPPAGAFRMPYPIFFAVTLRTAFQMFGGDF